MKGTSMDTKVTPVLGIKPSSEWRAFVLSELELAFASFAGSRGIDIGCSIVDHAAVDGVEGLRTVIPGRILRQPQPLPLPTMPPFASSDQVARTTWHALPTSLLSTDQGMAP